MTIHEPSPADPAAADPAEQTGEQGNDEQQDTRGANHEAAGYRRRLRNTEAERDVLTQRVERLQRADVERLAGQRLAQPGDVWTFGTQLAEVLDADGGIDPAAVDRAVQQIVEQRPGLEKGAAVRFPDLGQGQRESVPSDPTWADVFKKK